MKQNTHSTKLEEIRRQWHLIDLENKVLGRSATNISYLLIGKSKPYFTPHLDCGDYVVVINAEKVKVTGKKTIGKMYYRHSGYPGGFKQFNFKQMMNKDPVKVIKLTVKGMLPKNKLRDKRLKRLKIFIGSHYPYQDKFKKN